MEAKRGDYAALLLARVVHIGGGPGAVALALAERYNNLHTVVQDTAQLLGAVEEAGIPKELRGRVTFMPHDLFTTQTVDADVFLFRWTLRTWADKYCVAALRAQVPMLKSGGRFIVQDIIMPEPGTAPLWREKYLRSSDLSLAATFNSRDRTAADWNALFQEADPRFVLKSVTEPKGSALGILEVMWDAQS